jgi:hypothetical protein
MNAIQWRTGRLDGIMLRARVETYRGWKIFRAWLQLIIRYAEEHDDILGP